MIFLLIPLIWAQTIEAPSAKQLCLQDTAALKQLMETNNCRWKYGDVKNKQMRLCGSTLTCGLVDEAGPQYRLCLNIKAPEERVLAKEDIENIDAYETAICKNNDTHRTRCTYDSSRPDGTPVGNVSEEYCRVRTKKLVPAGAQQ